MSLQACFVLPKLETKVVGRGLYQWAETMDSTNKCAAELAKQGALDGSVAVCEYQSSGRGRLNRSWEAQAGLSLTQSVIHFPKDNALIPLISLAASLAMCRALSSLRLEAKIKWPNDVLLGNKKVAGILCERAGNAVVIGAGLNVNQREFPFSLRESATSMRLVSGKEFDLTEVFAGYLNQLEDVLYTLSQSGRLGFWAEYVPLCATLGKKVRVLQNHNEWSGFAQAIDENGCLVVLNGENRPIHLYSGDVSVRGFMGYNDEIEESAFGYSHEKEDRP